MPPHHSLKNVKAQIRAGNFTLRSNAIQDASNDFAWTPLDIQKCLLKLQNSHWVKTERHRNYPAENTLMDYYRAPNIMDGESIFTHIYIRDGKTNVIVSSFKRL